MRNLLVAALLLTVLVGWTSGLTPAIAPEAVLGHIKYLASDELKGRGNGQDGLERAADYIAAQFKAAGLRPGGVANDWFQPFELQAGLAVGDGNELRIETRGGQTVRLSLGSGYYPLAATPNESSAAPSAELDNLSLVFAGYG